MPVLRSSCAVKLGEVEFFATLNFPNGMLPLEIDALQVPRQIGLKMGCMEYFEVHKNQHKHGHAVRRESYLLFL